MPGPASSTPSEPAPVAPPPQTLTPPESPPLRLGEKLAYGAGGGAGALPNLGPIYLMDPIFVVLLGVSPLVTSLCAILYRVWDAITDALMGWISDNTRSRWGRRRPFILISSLLVGLWMPLIWLVNPEWELNRLILWMVVMQLVLLLFTTMWNIPYQCLLMEVTTDSDERTRVAAYRQYVGTAAWLGMGWVWFLAQHPIFGSDGGTDLLRGAFWISCLVGVIVIALGVLPAIFCRERLYHTVARRAKTSFRHDMKQTLTNRPFLWLVLCTMLFWVGSQANGGLAFYTKLYYVCGGDQSLAAKLAGIESTAAMVISILCVPLFERIARRHGKHIALMGVMGITLTASLSTYVFYTPEMPYLSIVSGLLFAPSGAAVWVLLPSLLGDVVDHDELRTGERRDGSFASVFSWIFKFAQSLAAGLSGWLVVAVGFEVGLKTEQAPETLQGMRLLLVIVPVICLSFALWVLLRFPLTRAQILENKGLLAVRRANAETGI